MKAVTVFSGFILLQSAFTLLIIIFWAANKGFDFTDEAYYLLSIDQAETSSDLFYYQHLISFFFGWTDPGLTGIRILRLFLTVVTAIFLSMGIRAFLFSSNEIRKVLPYSETAGYFSIAFILLAGGYSIYPQAISYNNFTLLALGGFAALLLFEETAIKTRKPSALVKWPLLLGIMISLAFCGKFTTGILLFISTACYLTASLRISGYSWNDLLRAFFFLMLGIASFLIISSVFVKSFPQWFRNLPIALDSVEGHAASDLLTIYSESVSYFFSALAERFLALPIVFLIWFVPGKKFLPPVRGGMIIYNAGILLLFMLLVKKIYDEEIWKSGVAGYNTALFFPALLSMCLPGLFLSRKGMESLRMKRAEILRLLPLILLLLLLPLLAVAGSDNSPHIQCIQFSFSWLLLLLMALCFVYMFAEKLPAVLFAVLLLAVSSIQVVHGITQSPYRLIGPIALQNNPVNLPGIGKFLTDKLTYGDISSFNEVAKASLMKEGDGLLVFGAVPGFISISGARVVASAWLRTELAEAACASIRKIPPARKNKVFVLLPRNTGLPAEVRTCLAGSGINFPEDYELKSTVRYSIFNSDFDFYAPR